MKLGPRDAAGFFAKPPAGWSGLLIYGSDPVRISVKRQDVVAALIGPEGEGEMRLSRMQGAELRRDGAQLLDAVKAQGFFPGPRVVLVEDATDTLADQFQAALDDWQDGDAQIVVTAGALKASSKLRKLFEKERASYAAAIYDDPPSRAEIAAELARAGLRDLPDAAMAELVTLSRSLDPGDFRQTMEKLALYKLGDTAPLSVEDIAAVAPISVEAGVDDLVAAVAEGRSGAVGPLIRRLEAQGVQPVRLAIMSLMHFRLLHTIAAAPGGVSDGVQALRPPVFGPRRDALLGQARRWGLARSERALADLIEADLTLRSSSNAPSMAVIERALLRLALVAQKA